MARRVFLEVAQCARRCVWAVTADSCAGPGTMPSGERGPTMPEGSAVGPPRKDAPTRKLACPWNNGADSAGPGDWPCRPEGFRPALRTGPFPVPPLPLMTTSSFGFASICVTIPSMLQCSDRWTTGQWRHQCLLPACPRRRSSRREFVRSPSSACRRSAPCVA